MELENSELKFKKWYKYSSIIALLGYTFYFAGKKIEGYFWLNYIALALLITNVFFILFHLYQIYKSRNQIEKVSNYYLRSSLSLLLNILIIFTIYALFKAY